jgi:hypothetical protein
MKNFKVLCMLLFLSFIYTSFLYSQHGTPNMRKVGVVDANQIKTVFNNFGVIAQPGSEGPRYGWIYPHNGYASDMSIVLGLELPIRDYRRGTLPPDGIPDTIHSVIITPVDRPGGGEGGGGKSYTFEPLPGYCNPSDLGVGRGVAISTDLESWPDLWADHPEYGTGVWNGLYGPNNFVGDEEALFVMDDFNDEENFLQNDFYPDSTNTSITGHGIEVRVRFVELNNPAFKDILFKIYDIRNTSLHNYHKLVFGNLTGTYVGVEAPEYADDVTLYYPKDNLIVVSDFNNYIDPVANPYWQGPVGMFGESFIYTPVTNKIASFDYFVPAGDISMSDDDGMWSRITPGHITYPSSVVYIDSIPYATRGEDGDYLWGSEYFSINSGQSKRFVTASAFGYSKDEILLKMKYAEALYNSNFDTVAVKNSISITSHNYHKVVSGNETITWNSINSNGTVEIWYSADGGNKWKAITKNLPNSGSYNWNTATFEDGAFAKLLIFVRNTSGFIYAVDESEYFTVNNSGNGIPFVKILNDELHPGVTITDEEYNFNLLVGDPENDPMLLKVYYSTNSDTVFHVSQNINVSSDTAFQTIPINLNIIPNSDRLRIKLEVFDGTSSFFDITPEFNKQNSRQILPPQNFEWVRHYAEVPVEIRVIDSTQFRGEEYIITFSDTVLNTPKMFSVFNKTTNQYVVLDETFYPNNESLAFDGMLLYTEDVLTTLDLFRSRWNNPHPQNLTFTMDQYTSTTLNAYRYPFDYKFVFSDSYSDSSNKLTAIFGNGAPPVNPNLNFKIYRNIEDNWERTQFAFYEPRTYRKDTLSFNDVVILSDPSGTEFSWRVTFGGDSSSNIPSGGDTLCLFTKKGLSVYDTIRVYGLTVHVNETPNTPATYSLSQNYPNPFNPSTKITYSVANAGIVTLKIYDILGREVSTLVNEEKSAGKYEVNFNASSFASGVYFYQINAASFIQTKKMVLIK